jgi:hypothetical protein
MILAQIAAGSTVEREDTAEREEAIIVFPLSPGGHILVGVMMGGNQSETPADVFGVLWNCPEHAGGWSVREPWHGSCLV